MRLQRSGSAADALRSQVALAQREAEGLRQEAVTLRLAQHESAIQSKASIEKRESLQQQVGVFPHSLLVAM